MANSPIIFLEWVDFPFKASGRLISTKWHGLNTFETQYRLRSLAVCRFRIGALLPPYHMGAANAIRSVPNLHIIDMHIEPAYTLHRCEIDVWLHAINRSGGPNSNGGQFFL